MPLNFFKKFFLRFDFVLRKMFSKIILIRKIYSVIMAILVEIQVRINNKIIIIFDCKSSPPTYGDFVSFIFLARLIIAKKKDVEILIINGDYRKDWDILKNPNYFINDLIKISNSYTYENCVKIISWNDFKNISRNHSKQIIFFSKIKNRYRIYNQIFNLMQVLYLFNKKIWNKVIIKLKKKDHFTVHLRYSIIGKFYSQKPTSSRNVALDDAKQVIEYLTKKHHDLNCIIVTDKDGMDYFYDLKKISKNVLFSKEISDSFYGDTQLVFSSRYYYVYKGGGISVFTFFSDVDFIIGTDPFHELFWNKKKMKLMSWSNKNQKVITNMTLKKFFSIEFN